MKGIFPGKRCQISEIDRTFPENFERLSESTKTNPRKPRTIVRIFDSLINSILEFLDVLKILATTQQFEALVRQGDSQLDFCYLTESILRQKISVSFMFRTF